MGRCEYKSSHRVRHQCQERSPGPGTSAVTEVRQILCSNTRIEFTFFNVSLNIQLHTRNIFNECRWPTPHTHTSYIKLLWSRRRPSTAAPSASRWRAWWWATWWLGSGTAPRTAHTGERSSEAFIPIHKSHFVKETVAGLLFSYAMKRRRQEPRRKLLFSATKNIYLHKKLLLYRTYRTYLLNKYFKNTFSVLIFVTT